MVQSLGDGEIEAGAMATVRRTPRAEVDLVGIWLYIATDIAQAADRLIRRFDEAFDLLSKNPAMGNSSNQHRAWARNTSIKSPA
jgi:plasmid stabilization system protein ParE